MWVGVWPPDGAGWRPIGLLELGGWVGDRVLLGVHRPLPTRTLTELLAWTSLLRLRLNLMMLVDCFVTEMILWGLSFETSRSTPLLEFFGYLCCNGKLWEIKGVSSLWCRKYWAKTYAFMNKLKQLSEHKCLAAVRSSSMYFSIMSKLYFLTLHQEHGTISRVCITKTFWQASLQNWLDLPPKKIFFLVFSVLTKSFLQRSHVLASVKLFANL